MTTTPTPDRALSTSPDIDTIKARMKVTWMAGDYGAFATYMEPGALEILAGWCIPPGSTLLDVACGAGQLTIPAARAGVRATGVDIATNSLGQARARAASSTSTSRSRCPTWWPTSATPPPWWSAGATRCRSAMATGRHGGGGPALAGARPAPIAAPQPW